jgi:hypothetical protein
VADREITVQSSKENETKTMARAEANPCTPHRGFGADHRRNSIILAVRSGSQGWSSGPRKVYSRCTNPSNNMITAL